MAQIHIYFGSQSGTAECFSEELCEEAEGQGIEAEVVDMQTFTPESFAARKIVVLVMSTYGEGEPTDNAVRFHKWASDPRNDGALKGQRFCVMGLGDMNYSKFNNMGILTDQNLERLGATRIYQRGIGDDSQDIAADFKRWKDGGLWDSLKAAIQEVRSGCGGATFAPPPRDQAATLAPTRLRPEIHAFYGQAEEGGAAKDVCEAVVKALGVQGVAVSAVLSLSDRKAVEAIAKLPKKALALVVADCSQDGLCSAGKKLVRNMNLELDAKSLAEKDIKLAALAIATSRCNASANALKEAIEQQFSAIPKAFERAGVPLDANLPRYVDAGVDSMEPVVQALASGLASACACSSTAPASLPGQAAEARRTRVLCAGPEAREAGDALAAMMPNAAAEEASLAALAAAVQARSQVVLAIECAADGGIADAARGLATQLAAAPVALKAQLRQLRFAMLAVAATDYGNAGERASANAARVELARAAAPVLQALQKAGASCVASAAIDLQDAAEEKLSELCRALQKGFTPEGLVAPAPQALPPQPKTAAGAFLLQMAADPAALPAEADGEPADTLARFYFDAEKARVLKVRELRQRPRPEEGLSTVEVEIEATSGLLEYSLGGTLSVLPENDPSDVEAALKLMGLSSADLEKWITLSVVDGGAGGAKVKRPLPTPCTLGEALRRYCDLGRAPTKKALAALQPTLAGEAGEHVARLLADPEALKSLQCAAACCRLHEFWAMLGVRAIPPAEFLVHCPRMKAREFTIASSPKATPKSITLCVSLTSHSATDMDSLCRRLKELGCLPTAAEPPAGRGRFFGTCSRWLTSRLKVGDTVLAKQRPSALHLPPKDVPVIMVGAGAGIAPFRGFWEELRRGSQTAPAALFFGCRHPDEDWLFKEEMNAAVKLGASGCSALARMQVGPKRPLACLFPAFSRPGEGEQGKYVQDVLRTQKVSVKHWIEKMDGYVFICGSTSMGNGVLDALSDMLDGGRELVDELRKEGRIVAEMWG